MTSSPGSVSIGFLLFGALISFGISLEAGVVRQKTRVNEGVHRTARRALTIGLVVAAFIMVTNYAYEFVLRSEPGEIEPSIGFGLFTGFVFALGFGGLDLRERKWGENCMTQMTVGRGR